MTASDATILNPNDRIGILGGGQLGRMLAMAATRLGLRPVILCPDENCPAAITADQHIIADYEDEVGLATLAAAANVVTYEFENVPAASVACLTRLGARVAPGATPLSIAQDRLKEKEFVRSLGGKTPEFYAVDSLEDLRAGLAVTGTPAILKTRRLGYDGKGQTRIGTDTDNLDRTWDAAINHAWAEVGARPSILEALVPFQCEISVIAARGVAPDATGPAPIAMYDPPKNDHRNGILWRSTVPAPVPLAVIKDAKAMTHTMLEALDYVGVVGVEFFVLADNTLMINEFAPRVHNSGHWTEAVCTISQFEQHIRAVAGWPLGDTTRHSDARMENLIGDEVTAWQNRLATPNVLVNLYGKQQIRPGRKMGHVTMVSA
ncbi:MAG: 5-(carboxyamino)imidazole ribonucleotide synthase [Pseudomonadota bacterium]